MRKVMSHVCCVSRKTTPGPIACTVPASTKIISPTSTGTHSSNFSSVPSAIAASNASAVAPSSKPRAIVAPGTASSTYQHSVLPRGCPIACACASSGCTCTDSLSCGNSSFTSSGNSAPLSLSIQAAPPSASPACAATSASVFPANAPVSTKLSGPVNQASPTGSPVPVAAYHGRKSRLPQGRSLNHGASRNGPSLLSAIAPSVVIVILLRLLLLLQQPRGHRRISHCILPQNRVQLLRVRAVRVREVHLRRLPRAHRPRSIRRIDQPIVLVPRVRRKRLLIARPGKLRSNQRRQRVIIIHRRQPQQRLHRPHHAHRRVEPAIDKRPAARPMRRIFADRQRH